MVFRIGRKGEFASNREGLSGKVKIEGGLGWKKDIELPILFGYLRTSILHIPEKAFL